MQLPLGDAGVEEHSYRMLCSFATDRSAAIPVKSATASASGTFPPEAIDGSPDVPSRCLEARQLSRLNNCSRHTVTYNTSSLPSPLTSPTATS